MILPSFVKRLKQEVSSLLCYSTGLLKKLILSVNEQIAEYEYMVDTMKTQLTQFLQEQRASIPISIGNKTLGELVRLFISILILNHIKLCLIYFLTLEKSRMPRRYHIF